MNDNNLKYVTLLVIPLTNINACACNKTKNGLSEQSKKIVLDF